MRTFPIEKVGACYHRGKAVKRQEITDRIRAHVASSYSIEEATLSVEGPLSDEIPADSLAIVSLAVFLEDEFEIRFQRADLNGHTFHSILTLAEYVADRMRG